MKKISKKLAAFTTVAGILLAGFLNPDQAMAKELRMNSENGQFPYKEIVAYQIYPMSFQDSNDDGIGDINGITSRLNYLKDLGINMIWMCPMYESPMDDNGYDISDYENINPMFGTMEDMQTLINEAKSRDIGIMLDLVVNHTSDEHRWFKEALKDPDSKYRDYYYFEKGDENGNPPCNWRSVFGGNVWEPVPGEENMYYFHSFSKRQPDLNWECEDMRKDVEAIVAGWMEKGIVGFRVDAINHIKKSEFKNVEPDDPDGLAACIKYARNAEGIEEYYKYIKDIFDKNNCITVCEASGVPYSQLGTYIGPDGTFSMMFDFNYSGIDIMNENYFEEKDWSVKELREKIYESQEGIKEIGWSAPFFENHDFARSTGTYIKDEKYIDEGAKALAVLNLLLRGTPFIYQGQELGAENFNRTDISEFNDIKSKDQYEASMRAGFSKEEALAQLNRHSRDNGRTPFAWNDEQYGGFSKVEPWIKMSEEYPEKNATKESSDRDSVLACYKRIIKLRAEHDAFIDGDFEPVRIDDNVISYIRKNNKEEFAVLVNLSKNTVPVNLSYKDVVLNTQEGFDGRLKPYQAVTLRLK